MPAVPVTRPPLCGSPFTDLNPLGVAGLFDETKSARVIPILKDVRDRAAA